MEAYGGMVLWSTTPHPTWKIDSLNTLAAVIRQLPFPLHHLQYTTTKCVTPVLYFNLGHGSLKYLNHTIVESC